MRLLIVLTGLWLSQAPGQVLPAFAPNLAILSIVNNLDDNELDSLPHFSCKDVYSGAGLAVYPYFATQGPGVRDYCLKWVYANSRERALYCGGNHGTPHKFNDVWEYDLPSNTWIMLHKPDCDTTGHTWWGLTYNQEKDLLYWMSPQVNGGATFTHWALLQNARPPMAVFDPYAQTGWTVHPNKGSGFGIDPANAGALEYVPGRNIALWYASEWNGNGLWAFNLKDSTWTQRLADSYTYLQCDSCPHSEAVMNYDPANDVLVAMKDSLVYKYDLDANQWHHVLTGSGFSASDFRGPMMYDTLNKVHLVYYYPTGKYMIYDAAANTLKQMIPTGNNPAVTGYETMAFYHKGLNAFVFYQSRPNPGRMWVYRYKRIDAAQIEQLHSFSKAVVSVTVSPNPFNSMTAISISQRQVFGKIACRVYDMNGRMVKDFGALTSTRFSWDADGLPGGIYTISVRTGDRGSLIKAIVLR